MFLKELYLIQFLNFLKKTKFPSPNQSGFRLNSSFENQLQSIVHSIYAEFDQSPSFEVKAKVLDIPKAFDKVWHKGLLHKLKTVGIIGELHRLLQSFLSNCFQRVVLNDQSSNVSPILTGFPQV